MQENSENIYVFAVCGEKKHIDTLHFSLKYLKHFSKNKIIVVTNSKINELPVHHDNIVDIETPAGFNAHQASIWIKTSLHKILPVGPLYCYLDSDVIAVNRTCDTIFENFVSPISFALDQKSLDDFSPYAMNCNCLEKQSKERENFEKSIAAIIHAPNYPPDFKNARTHELMSVLQEISLSPISNLFPLLKICIGLLGIRLRVKKELYLNYKQKTWELGNDKFRYPFLWAYRKQIRKLTPYTYSLSKMKWKSGDVIIGENNCKHLLSALSGDFNIHITQSNFYHWNGGVFLFNKESQIFMEMWHNLTMQIFRNPDWKTRDQGTLIATVWNLGLESHPALSELYNFKTDIYKLNLKLQSSSPEIVMQKNNEKITPKFLHVYHEFGNKNWDVWQAIEDLI